MRPCPSLSLSLSLLARAPTAIPPMLTPAPQPETAFLETDLPNFAEGKVEILSPFIIKSAASSVRPSPPCSPLFPELTCAIFSVLPTVPSPCSLCPLYHRLRPSPPPTCRPCQPICSKRSSPSFPTRRSSMLFWLCVPPLPLPHMCCNSTAAAPAPLWEQPGPFIPPAASLSLALSASRFSPRPTASRAVHAERPAPRPRPCRRVRVRVC